MYILKLSIPNKEDVVNLEAGDLNVHSPEYFRSEVEFESKRLTSFTRGMGLVNPAMQPLPQGYFNYDTDKIETLPEQFLLNLVGYNHLHLGKSGNNRFIL